MTKIVSKLEKVLISLLVFLLPSQLAIHFWPQSSFVFGIRVDYLAPAVYVTDILFCLIFALWLKRNLKRFLSLLSRFKFYLLFILFFTVINSIFSVNPVSTIYRWVKVVEFGLFVFYVSQNSYFKSRTFYLVLLGSLISFSLIGITQFFLGRTIGGYLYWVGERNFTSQTPGVALTNFLNREQLRAYSTFSHPNSFAGYLAVGLLLLLGEGIIKKWGRLLLITPVLGLFLTFSLSSFLALSFCLALYISLKLKMIRRQVLLWLLPSVFIISLLLAPLSNVFISYTKSLSPEILQRIELSRISGQVITKSPLVGNGLNTFIISETSFGNFYSLVWLLQPVHNIFLLIFSETGLIGLVLIYLVFAVAVKVSVTNKNLGVYFSLLLILITGMTDHYWFTLQQNNFLLSLVIGKTLLIKTENNVDGKG